MPISRVTEHGLSISHPYHPSSCCLTTGSLGDAPPSSPPPFSPPLLRPSLLPLRSMEHGGIELSGSCIAHILACCDARARQQRPEEEPGTSDEPGV